MTPGGLVPDFARFAIPRACLCSLPGTGPLPYRLCCLLLSVHVIASGLSSSRSLLRCHLLKDAFPSCSIKNNAYTHTHTHTKILYSQCPSLFFSLALILTCIIYSYLYVRPLRAGTLFCSLLCPLDLEQCSTQNNTRYIFLNGWMN